MPQPITEENLKIITKKVYALYAKHGFEGISIDEICRQTNISKATLYRYFTSKEDIVHDMTDYLISSLDSVQFGEISGLRDLLDDIRKFYIKSILVEAVSGSKFLSDLAQKFPDTYMQCLHAMQAMQERFAGFYQEAVDREYFRDLPFPLVSRQFANMLSTIINMDYLEMNKITLPEAIRDYYRMFLCQILKEEILFVTDAETTYDFADELADELQQDFFIDSIRR